MRFRRFDQSSWRILSDVIIAIFEGFGPSPSCMTNEISFYELLHPGWGEPRAVARFGYYTLLKAYTG